MKRSFYFSITAALMLTSALTSCSSDEPIEVNKGRAIDFRSSVGGRGTEVIDGKLDSICVTAIIDKGDAGKSVYFGGGNKDNNLIAELFTKKEGKPYFCAETDFYWPGDNSPLDFYAYAPTYDGKGIPYITGVTIDDERQVIENFQPRAIMSQQFDLLTAKAEGKNKKNDESNGVDLNFHHQLAQIEIRACAANPDFDFYVGGVRIARVCAKGTFRFSNDEWVLGSFDYGLNKWTIGKNDKTTYDYEDLIVKEGAEAPEINWTKLLPLDATTNPKGQYIMGDPKDGNAFLIPQELTAWDREYDELNGTHNYNDGAYLAILLKVTRKNKENDVIYPWTGEYKWAAVPLSGEWKANHKYVYTLNLSKGAGYVDPDEPQPGVPILTDPIGFKVTVIDFADPDDEETIEFLN